jgi:hypothetical protein
MLKNKYEEGDTSWLDHISENSKEWPLFFHGNFNA